MKNTKKTDRADTTPRTFTKHGEKRALQYEAACLAWLAHSDLTNPDPRRAPVAPVLQLRDNTLVEPQLGGAHANPSAAHAFGRALAHTHAGGASHWGCPPSEWQGDGWMGRTRLPLVTTPKYANWGEFYAAERVRPYLRAARNSGAFSRQDTDTLERVCVRLETGMFDAPQPQLLQRAGAAVARIHGDLWTGNVLWTHNWPCPQLRASAVQPSPSPQAGEPVGVLIDPAAHGGHAETDLATLSVFGCPHLEEIYRGYNETSRLADGWRERIDLHTLHILVVHVALFGAGYTRDTLAVARHYA